MRKNGAEVISFVVARAVAAGLLIWALGKHPYDYYILLRWVVCGVAVFGIYYAIKAARDIWAWPFGISGLLFNPIIPVHLNRNTWRVIDLAVACIFFLSIFMLRRSSHTRGDATDRPVQQ